MLPVTVRIFSLSHLLTDNQFINIMQMMMLMMKLPILACAEKLEN